MGAPVCVEWPCICDACEAKPARRCIRQHRHLCIECGMIPLAKPDLSGNERKYLLEAFDSGYLSHQGTFEDRFEDEFSKWIGKPALATSSGTGALHLALLAMGVGPLDSVIVPSMTFGATASVVKAVGATPILVDADTQINWDQVRERIGNRTKAIMVVHLYGERCHIPDDIKVPIIEDCCEALWIKPRGIGCYSFYGNKAITTGEGGMLVGLDARDWRDGGFDSDYDMKVPGLNYRMTNLQAAIGCAQLERADDLINRRLKNAAYYKQMLVGFGKWLFVVKTPDPKGLQAHLKKNGVDSRPVFKPLHLTRPFEQKGSFPKAEAMWKSGLCLPTGPHLTEEDLRYITGLINDYHKLQRIAVGSSELATQV